MNNMFKTNSEKKFRQRQHNHKKDSDFRKFVNKTTFEIKDEDFPELIKINSLESSSSTPDSQLNFKDASLKNNEDQEVPDDVIPHGWVKYEINNGEIFALGNVPDDDESDYFDETDLKKLFDNLTNNWNTYKTNYDNLHGEGAYDRLYGTHDCELSAEDDTYDIY
jgi:hypothetical protein